MKSCVPGKTKTCSYALWNVLPALLSSSLPVSYKKCRPPCETKKLWREVHAHRRLKGGGRFARRRVAADLRRLRQRDCNTPETCFFTSHCLCLGKKRTLTALLILASQIEKGKGRERNNGRPGSHPQTP